MDNISADGYNITFKRHRLNSRFAMYYHDLVDNSAQYQLSYLNPGDQKSRHAKLAAISLEDLDNTDPGQERSEDKEYRFGPNYAILKLKSFNFYQPAQWELFMSCIFPDHEIIPTIGDYLTGRDVELEMALALIRENPVEDEWFLAPSG